MKRHFVDLGASFAFDRPPFRSFDRSCLCAACAGGQGSCVLVWRVRCASRRLVFPGGGRAGFPGGGRTAPANRRCCAALPAGRRRRKAPSFSKALRSIRRTVVSAARWSRRGRNEPMLHDALLIAGLKARNARTAVCRWFHIAGTDPSKDRSLSLRMYQIYVSAMVAAALAAVWLAALAQVEIVAASFSAGAAEAVVRGLGLAAAGLFGVACLKSMRSGPFSFSDADVAFLLTGPVRLQLVLVAELVPAVAKAALVGALVGFAAGVGCAAAGLAVDPLAMAVDASLLLASVSGASWVVGVSRVRRCKAGPDGGRTGKPPLLFARRWVRVLFVLAIGAASLAGIACAPVHAGRVGAPLRLLADRSAHRGCAGRGGRARLCPGKACRCCCSCSGKLSFGRGSCGRADGRRRRCTAARCGARWRRDGLRGSFLKCRARRLSLRGRVCRFGVSAKGGPPLSSSARSSPRLARMR